MPALPRVTVACAGVSKYYESKVKPASSFGFKPRKASTVHALHEVSLVSRAGESIGIVGRNGSGKSTLLRLISGAESPTSGRIAVSAQPTLLGVSAALQGVLSGRQNIELGLYAMGLSPEEVRVLTPNVADWAAIGSAIDRPLKTYSSGMRARLVFSISTAVRREILLVDEALSTGDKAFADRAEARMESFLEDSGTVFIVSHGAGTIQKYCDRAIWLNDGSVIADGDAVSVVKNYVSWSNLQAAGDIPRANRRLKSASENFPPQFVELS